MKLSIHKAIRFATKKHNAQLDDCGCPYIRHPLEVYELLKVIAPDDENLLMAGVLHDTIEDTDTTYKELVKEFGKDVADLVNEVSHEGSKDDYGFYFPRLQSRRGIILKFADRISNLNHMNIWDQKRQIQYLKRSKFWKDGSDLNPNQ